ncbi:MAG: hypothetical protein KatS3mg012_0321 [Gaiellaceae bacterium]|nr:MAG: hypothetical protein KatS3mg012_0321 [Gaiellaceae bacterium]
MRVGLSLLTLVPAVSGGSETYARALARELARRGEVDAVALVPTLAPDAGEGLPTRVVDAYRAGRGSLRRAVSMVHATLWPGRLRRHYADLDLVHFPLTVPIPRVHAPTVVTLHDVQHLDLPRNFSRAERAFRRLAYDRAARMADAVVVISEFVRGRAIELIDLDPERVHVVHLGVDHELYRPGDERRGDFLLYPARPWPHKNHELLFRAFSKLRRRHRGLELVLPSYEGPVPEGARAVGHVSRSELARLYRTAAALVFPSLYEGFGLPPLEAMACGCPVACSNAASLPEVVGDAARLFDPESVEEIVAAVEDVLAEPEQWSERGRARATAFTWEATARAHCAVYSELVA